jgi:hypothetical protein
LVIRIKSAIAPIKQRALSAFMLSLQTQLATNNLAHIGVATVYHFVHDGKFSSILCSTP